MKWTFENGIPIYMQILRRLRTEIASGAYPPGAKLPPVRELALEAGVNPNTMQRALGELERRGLVFSQRTSGRFVTEEITVIDGAKKTLAGECVKSFLQAMEDLGYEQAEIINLLQQAGEKEEDR